MNSFPDSLPGLASAAEMRAWDAATAAFGIPDTMLMQNAANAIFEILKARYDLQNSGNICIFTGPGNNGGDGFCLARLLFDAGAKVSIFALRAPESLTGAAAWHADLAIKSGIPIYLVPGDLSKIALSGFILSKTGSVPKILIDAILGTGLSRNLSDRFKTAISELNRFSSLFGSSFVSIDIPSGLNSEYGEPMPIAIEACLTITLAAIKRGIALPRATRYCGEVVCAEIGIPKKVRNTHPLLWRLLDTSLLAEIPGLPEDSFKNSYGHVYVIGGAGGYAGAASLASIAALRTGCGLVTACAPQACLAAIKNGWPEIMTLPFGPGSDWQDDFNLELARASSIVLGPGMTRTSQAAKLLEKTLALPHRPPSVIDADALTIIGDHPDLLTLVSDRDILTPHPGEAARLLKCNAADIQGNRWEALENLCKATPAVIILKGAATLIGQGRQTRILSPFDIPALAIGGAGDVLAGCIGSLIGQKRFAKISSAGKAAIGALIHALAALDLSRKYSERGCTASQLANALPFAWKKRIPISAEKQKCL